MKFTTNYLHKLNLSYHKKNKFFMLKSLLFPLVFCVSVFELNAQQGFHLGARFLPQSTWMFNDDDSDSGHFKYVPTYRSAAGAGLSYFFTEGFGIGTELIFSRQGQKFTIDTLGNAFNMLNYRKIPILIHLASNPSQGTHFYFYAGPQIMMLQNATWGREISGLNLNVDATSFYKSQILGALLGLGAGFKIKPYLYANLGIRLEYSWEDAEDKTNPVYFPNRRKTWHALGAIDAGLKFVISTKKKATETN